MSGIALELAYLVAAICFVLALRGLSSPPPARAGNLIGAFGAAVAVVATYAMRGLDNRLPILLAVVVGSAVAVPTARRVRMTAMPQLVAIFNGVGGGAAALVSIVEFMRGGADESFGVVAAVVFSAVVGCVSFTGSGITFA